MSGRQPSVACPPSRGRAGTTAPTSGGVIPDRTRRGAIRPRATCIGSPSTRRSPGRWSSSAIPSAVRHPPLSPRLPRRGVGHGLRRYGPGGCGQDSRHAAPRAALDPAVDDSGPFHGLRPAGNDAHAGNRSRTAVGATRAPRSGDVLARLRRRRNLALADAQVVPERATAEQVRAAGGLEDMPLIVLTQGRGLGGGAICSDNSPSIHAADAR